MKRTLKYSQLTATQIRLLQEADFVRTNAYNPYSNFSVGAALLTTRDQKIFSGCNVEDVTHSALHAEINAIGNAVANGYLEFDMIAVIGNPKDDVMEDILTPCGICRQKLIEFASRSGVDTLVIMSNSTKTKIWAWNISDLLPLAFNFKALGKK